MARQLRIEYENALYHLTGRARERRVVFNNSEDCERFLDLLEESLGIYGVQCLAFALMKNHYQAIVRTPNANLSAFAHRFNVTYSMYYNQRHNRSGNLYRDRFKTIVVEEGEYAVELSRYVHLAPLRMWGWITKPANERAAHLAEYRWTTLGGYCRKSGRRQWVDYSTTLDYFGGDVTAGRRAYRKYVWEGTAHKTPNPIDAVKSQVILGSDGFVEKIRANYLRRDDRSPKGKGLSAQRRPMIPVETILQAVVDHYGMNQEELFRKWTRRGTAPAVAMSLCYELAGLTQKEIAGLFGVEHSAVSSHLKQMRRRVEKDKNVREALETIRSTIGKMYLL